MFAIDAADFTPVWNVLPSLADARCDRVERGAGSAAWRPAAGSSPYATTLRTPAQRQQHDDRVAPSRTLLPIACIAAKLTGSCAFRRRARLAGRDEASVAPAAQ